MLTLVWDVDDVLNDLMRAWFEQAWLPAHPACRLVYEDLRSNPPHALLGVPLDEYLASLDHFRLSGGLENLAPVPQAVAWFECHGSRFRHAALTAVAYRSAPLSAAWVTRHFGAWIRSFNFVPSSRAGECLPHYDASKAEFLAWWGKGDIIVDDREDILEAAKKLGLRGILMPRPWNRGAGGIDAAWRELEQIG